jgi:NAD(P)-dependent dehydrogenase (short-subunit alcohol dehydrogenase family)
MFTGKVAIVTGAAAGIGEVTAKLLASQGLSVVVADVLDDAGEQVAADIRMKGGSASFLHVDVSARQDVERMVPFAVSEFGSLDYAVNNAGVGHRPARLHEIDEAEWDRVIGIDLKGVWYCLKAEIPHLIAHGGGAIVNTASVAGLIPEHGVGAYAVAKHGVIGMIRQAALDTIRDNVRVNGVAPGLIETPSVRALDEATRARYAAQLPTGKMGQPEDIAHTISWLLSDEASYVTGMTHVTDGGRSLI